MEKMEYSIFYNNWENTKAAESSTNRPTNKVINGLYVNWFPKLRREKLRFHPYKRTDSQKDISNHRDASVLKKNNRHFII